MSEPVVESMAAVRSHLADTIDRARREATPTIITRRGKEEAVLLDLDEYRHLKRMEEAAENLYYGRLLDERSKDEGPGTPMEIVAVEVLGREAAENVLGADRIAQVLDA